jgi:DNA-binding MarR family transcriptional regulator
LEVNLVIEERLVLENLNEKIMVTGTTACHLYLQHAEKAAGVLGFSFGEMVVLRHLRGRKEEMNLRTLKENVLMLSGASITKITDKLVRKGYIKRRENPASRREKLVKITPKGEKVFSKLMEEIHQLNTIVLKGFTVADKKHFYNGLKKLLDRVVELGPIG